MTETQILPPPTTETLHYMVDAQRNVTPLDPITQEPLPAYGLPESISTDPKLREGYRFLEENAGDINFDLLLVRHDSAEDLQNSGIDLEAESRSLADEGGVLFLEEAAKTAEQQESIERALNTLSSLEVTRAEDAKKRLRARTDSHTFIHEVMHEITGTGVRVMLPDYRQGQDAGPERALEEWKSKLAQLEQDIQGSTSSAEYGRLVDQWQSSYFGFIMYRNKYLLANIGLGLKERADGAKPHGKLLIGSTHDMIGEELAQLGATVNYKGIEHDEGSPATQILTKSIGHAVLSLDDRTDLLALSFFEQRSF